MTDLITKQTQIDYEYLVDVAAEICQLIDDDQPMLVIVDDVLSKFAQRIEQPHLQRIAELEQELHYANQAARVEADMCDQARAGMKQLREALQLVADKLGYEWLDKDFEEARQILENTQ